MCGEVSVFVVEKLVKYRQAGVNVEAENLISIFVKIGESFIVESMVEINELVWSWSVDFIGLQVAEFIKFAV